MGFRISVYLRETFRTALFNLFKQISDITGDPVFFINIFHKLLYFKCIQFFSRTDSVVSAEPGQLPFGEAARIALQNPDRFFKALFSVKIRIQLLIADGLHADQIARIFSRSRSASSSSPSSSI